MFLIQLLDGVDKGLGASGNIAEFPFKFSAFVQNDHGRKSGPF